ncbi:MAG: Gfo/Idh/MocA family oxidoreductase [Clostridia bacterium]|nr:Gfo/Idh/MocA family oxidoreductase [Clostridia bacterium]
MLKIGLIGCGKIGQVRHLPEYAANPHCEITALYDINQERAQELAVKYGAKAYASYQELLASDVDAVSVCSSNASHAEIAIAALKAGKHVLCEKPMATTLEDSEAMVAAAKAAGKRLMIGQNQRLAGAHVKAKELIDAGAIGRVITFKTAFCHGGPETWSVDPGLGTWFFDKKRAAMGAMADLGVHKTDLIQYLTGQTIVEVTAKLSVLDKKYADGTPITVDDNAFCIYRMDGGAMGTMTVSWTDYGAEDNSTVLWGTEGVLRIYDHPEHTLVLVKKSGETEYYDVDQIQTNDNQTASGVIDMFVDCILDENAPYITGESALTAMRAVFGAIESSEKGCTVSVNG